MATTIHKFDKTTKLIMGSIDLRTSPIKIALVTSSYVFDSTDESWADASTYEVSTGNGYATGGNIITSPTLTATDGVCVFDAEDVTWTSLTKTFRGAIIYASGTFDTITNPVLFYILFDSTPADRIIEDIDFIVKWNSNGILAI